MTIRNIIGFIATAIVFVVAILIGRALWVHYMDEPWTRDGRVRAEVVNIAPDVSGAVVELPVRDNQFVHKGDLLMQIDPSHYQIAVEQAQAAVAARKAELQMRRDDAQRRADMDSLVVSKENRENATHTASAAEAQYQQALAALDAAKLNLERTRVVSPVDGYVTNLNVYRGDYAISGSAKLAVVDSNSFWVYGYFEETKLPHVRVGDKADIRLMSGGTLKGHVESISRGIYDRDNPQSRELLADVNPTFNWVRLAQRVPVRVKIDSVPEGVLLSAGTTCTVVVTPS
ncbi:HlyD family secretion protein [Paraburkholderia hospita]|jgi:RND family efflux transporter MFP subunit|uniref:Secretion protein HlyD family protein n=1 Tax=Paraburkholderia hospita TaxID=169430 RepID=A0ABN0FI50_9BURK|nr:HlyD family secretion protein [Paraburkholderia hospita]EUC17818.1 efflux transporter, RND family, MFP subunit [Burkholderia sp. BT03]SKC72509.1 RND family efflux transporter, MFP subunit [Burkholderia sp. CF099]SOE53682.1 RND family efflux transporter, MFP subunit [Burkholderia sp. YR290]EIM98411.1 secretion protein HlyD family protein [Paraburkholderia hospita]OUL71775.1 efflux transporter periplasmic adaptor subunit [Paraburkholderia hospita]